MKIRTDFITNSSSSSYIICFARIANKEKAESILKKYDFTPMSVDDINKEKRWGTLGCDWAGAEIFSADDTMKNHPTDTYVLIDECQEADYDDDGDPIYNYDFGIDSFIDDITEENGFADKEVSEGEGRNG